MAANWSSALLHGLCSHPGAADPREGPSKHALCPHLPPGLVEEHSVGALNGKSEGLCGLGGQLWLAGGLGVYMDSCIPGGVYPSVTIKHSKIGAIH